MLRPRLLGTIGALLVVLGVTAGSQSAYAGRDRAGTLRTATAYSAALGETIAYTVYLPSGYARDTGRRYPVLYLLHGRGDSMQAWTRVKTTLDGLIADGKVPPVIAVLPDAPWSGRGSWYVDSAYTGADYPGRAVETALTRDLVSHVDSTYRTAAHRGARLIGGYSMGGAGALRLALAHQDLFAHALVLSPAVYTPLPPADSSAREFGAFGSGTARFDDAVYQRLNYPALLPTLNPDLPVRMFIAVGDDEWPNPDPADARHDLDFESAALYNTIRRSPAVSADFRVLDGGHDWTVWTPAFAAGLERLGATLSVVPPAGLPGPLYGTTGEDRAGGIAAHPDGSATLAYAAGGPANGALDAVVTRLGPDGHPQWTRTLGSPANDRPYGVSATPDGGAVTAGYTRGDLDGHHPGSSADDAFVARFSGTGDRTWLTQFGDPAQADRVYATASTSDGGAYVAGYTKGALDGPNAGDKDAFLARISPAGALVWLRQFGGAGEDKAYALAVDRTGVYVAGVAGGAMPGATALGGLDGWVAKYDADGARQWLIPVGGPGDDLLAGIAVTANGTVVVTGSTSTDVLTIGLSAAGQERWRLLSGGSGQDVGAEVVPLSNGDVTVVGFTSSTMGVPAGGTDVLALRVDQRGKQVGAAQFGSPRTDGADPFGEENLYATRAGDRVLVTGFTTGAPVGGTALGNGDVFLASIDPATGLP